MLLIKNPNTHERKKKQGQREKEGQREKQEKKGGGAKKMARKKRVRWTRRKKNKGRGILGEK